MSYIDNFLQDKLDVDAIEVNTYMAYGGDLKRFAKYFKEYKNMSLEEVVQKITPKDIDGFKKWMAYNNENQYAISTVNRTLGRLKQFNEYLIHEEITNNDFMKGVKKIKYNPKNERIKRKKLKDFISKDEFNTMINGCKTGYRGGRDKWFNLPRNKFIISLMGSTGTRINEVVNMRLNMIYYVGKIPFITFTELDTKADIPKRIPICGKTLEFYKEYMEQRKKIQVIDEGYIILSSKGRKLNEEKMNKFLEKLCKECNIHKHITNHCFRHLFSSVAHILGISPVIINVIGGWSNNNNMQYMYAENGITDEVKIETVQKIQDFLYE